MVDHVILRNVSTELAAFLETYKIAINILLGFITVTIITLLVVNIVQLGAYKSHPMLRRRAMKNILITGLCLGLLTISSTIYIVLLRLL